MKKHNEQIKMMAILDNLGFRFRSNDLKPESVMQYYKRNGSGHFVIYTTTEFDVQELIKINSIEAIAEHVILDNGFNTTRFEAWKIKF
jgi:hypothetical protein